jgi:hypothetical protein
MKNMKKNLTWLILTTILPLFACNAVDQNITSVEDSEISFSLPTSIDVSKGEEYTFTAQDGKSLKSTDSFIIESTDGISYVCTLTNTKGTSFSIIIPAECKSGLYNVYIKRDTRKKSIGKVYINFVDKLDFTPDKGTTLYGLVSCQDEPVEGVVVSDGVEVTRTNADGIYQLQSDKQLGYVFISIPSDYEVPAEGILPQFYKMVKGNADSAERADFTLNKVSGQDSYKVLMLGDIHLANRTSDSKQFKEFTTDLNNYRNFYLNEKIYAITLGDMTWDLYWYSNSFAIPDYVNTMNNQIKDLQVFHTIGNHDNDYKATSDAGAQSQFIGFLAPTYYSFNIGKVHYVIMDDIDCSNYDGSTSRDYVKQLSSAQLRWLAKDLEYVDKSTPVVVAMHAQVYYPLETGGFKVDHDASGSSQLFDILSGYQVHFVTGHTHLTFNVTPEESVTKGENFYEHNVGAVCASWWWSGHLTPGVHVSLDGTPGGYSIWDISGSDIKWLYKSTGWSENYQFRSYDLNNVSFSLADVPDMPTNIASVKKDFEQYVDAYPANKNNEVLINIWNWNPRWTVSVTDESGKSLPVSTSWAYDPLHIAALSVKRFNSSSITSTPSFITKEFTHFFKVKVADADTDIKITVKDEFGHVWTEEMERPKAFSTDEYKAK